MDESTSAMWRTLPAAKTSSHERTSSANPAACRTASRASVMRALTSSTDESNLTVSRLGRSTSSRHLRMPSIFPRRRVASSSTRSISATARGMRRKPARDWSSSADEMSSATS